MNNFFILKIYERYCGKDEKKYKKFYETKG